MLARTNERSVRNNELPTLVASRNFKAKEIFLFIHVKAFEKKSSKQVILLDITK